MCIITGVGSKRGIGYVYLDLGSALQSVLKVLFDGGELQHLRMRMKVRHAALEHFLLNFPNAPDLITKGAAHLYLLDFLGNSLPELEKTLKGAYPETKVLLILSCALVATA